MDPSNYFPSWFSSLKWFFLFLINLNRSVNKHGSYFLYFLSSVTRHPSNYLGHPKYSFIILYFYPILFSCVTRVACCAVNPLPVPELPISLLPVPEIGWYSNLSLISWITFSFLSLVQKNTWLINLVALDLSLGSYLIIIQIKFSNSSMRSCTSNWSMSFRLY